MDGNQKFWIWFWLIVITGFVCLMGIVADGTNKSNLQSEKAIMTLVDKGYSPNEASCAITHDTDTCKAAKNANNVKVENNHD